MNIHPSSLIIAIASSSDEIPPEIINEGIKLVRTSIWNGYKPSSLDLWVSCHYYNSPLELTQILIEDGGLKVDFNSFKYACDFCNYPKIDYLFNLIEEEKREKYVKKSIEYVKSVGISRKEIVEYLKQLIEEKN